MNSAANVPAESALQGTDFHSVTWARLQEVAQARLDAAHRRLEQVQPEATSNEWRGRIAELRFLLDMEETFHRTLDDVALHDAPDFSPR